jgi:hypothetical protein
VALAHLVQARPRAPLRPRRPILSGWETRSLTRSAVSFRSITSSQKEATAFLLFLLVSNASKIAGGESSHPISLVRECRGAAHAGQCSSVCCAESTLASQWWQRVVASFPIQCRYSLKHPCPVSTLLHPIGQGRRTSDQPNLPVGEDGRQDP